MDDDLPGDDPLAARLAARLAALRVERGWSLEELGEASGVSRSTLSRLERGETSPTATLLNRLCAAYGRPMSRLLAEVEADPPRLVRHAEQAVWTDPTTGFVRRSVSPPGTGFVAELVEGRLPPGAEIAYDAPSVAGLEQHLWVLEGRLQLTVDGVEHALRAGDCLRFRVDGPTRFTCPRPHAVRYALVICPP